MGPVQSPTPTPAKKQEGALADAGALASSLASASLGDDGEPRVARADDDERFLSTRWSRRVTRGGTRACHRAGTRTASAISARATWYRGVRSAPRSPAERRDARSDCVLLVSRARCDEGASGTEFGANDFDVNVKYFYAPHFVALAHFDLDRAGVQDAMLDALREEIAFVEEWVKHELRQMDGSHDWWHIHRVRNNALAIARKERPGGSDPAFDIVVELAALVHDVQDWKYSGDPDAGTRAIARDVAGMIRTITDVYPNVLRRVLNVVQRVGFKDELGDELGEAKKSSPSDLPLELKVVQDADRLDAIGAIGIARTFCYGGAKGHAMHVPGVEPRERLTRAEYVGDAMTKKRQTVESTRVDTTVNHFHEKLLKLRGLMKTETGRAMAEKRHARMVEFLEAFHEEWEGE